VPHQFRTLVVTFGTATRWGMGEAAARLGCPRCTKCTPNAQPSTASVPIAVLLYSGPLFCGFNVLIKG